MGKAIRSVLGMNLKTGTNDIRHQRRSRTWRGKVAMVDHLHLHRHSSGRIPYQLADPETPDRKVSRNLYHHLGQCIDASRRRW